MLAPANTAVALANGEPLGNHSDLYPRWLGARELLLHQRDPYSMEVTREIQSGFYGYAVNHVSLHAPGNKESFVYPVYVVFLLAPTVEMPFSTVQRMSRWFLLGCIAASVPLWMLAIGFWPRAPYIVSGMLLALSSSPAILEFHQQNLAALVVFLLAAAAAAAVRRWLILSGSLLALATVKPDTSGLLVLWFLFWAVSCWRERKRMIWSFVVTLLILVLAAQAVAPNWLGEFLGAVYEYPAYGADPSILQVLFPGLLAALITVALVLFLGIVCWQGRKAREASSTFDWALALVASVPVVLLPRLAPYNESLLVPALLVLLAQHRNIWQSGIIARSATGAAFASQIWQWAAAVFLSLCSLVLSTSRLQANTGAPNYTALSVAPLTVLAVLVAFFTLQNQVKTGSPSGSCRT
ncbi:MAG TPA: hypothetical protein VN948_19475 [Terriglobales bacterium]|nr:hypothetical protein [Terriglobales bacterium]